MENELDLDNLTKDDFMAMAQYCGQLEREVESIKANALAILTQRDNAMKKLMELQHAIKLAQAGVKTVVTSTLQDTDLKLVNPEQWAVPKGRVSSTPKSNKS